MIMTWLEISPTANPHFEKLTSAEWGGVESHSQFLALENSCTEYKAAKEKAESRLPENSEKSLLLGHYLAIPY